MNLIPLSPWQGNVTVGKSTDITEQAVHEEFEAISERGGVLGAMDTMYQRGKIQKESSHVEHKKHDGSLPLVGVNNFLGKDGHSDVATKIELIRSTPEEKGQQIDNVATYQANRNARTLPRASGGDDRSGAGLAYLQKAARERRNVFEALMEAVKTHSLGQISHALYEVGGECRQNM